MMSNSEVRSQSRGIPPMRVRGRPAFRFIDLFAGIGGMLNGAHRGFAGVESRFWCGGHKSVGALAADDQDSSEKAKQTL